MLAPALHTASGVEPCGRVFNTLYSAVPRPITTSAAHWPKVQSAIVQCLRTALLPQGGMGYLSLDPGSDRASPAAPARLSSTLGPPKRRPPTSCTHAQAAADRGCRRWHHSVVPPVV